MPSMRKASQSSDSRRIGDGDAVSARSAISTGPSATLESVSVEPSGTLRFSSGHFTPVRVEAFEIAEGNDADARSAGKLEVRVARE